MSRATILKNDETLRVEFFEPGKKVSIKVFDETMDFILTVEDLNTWFSLAESQYLKRCLRGELADTSVDRFFLGRIGGEIVGNVGYQISRGSKDIGSLGWVYTAPAHRGKGISSTLTKMAIEDFRMLGGRSLYLGTANPIAHHVYEKFGFRDYNGIVMRYVKPGIKGDYFDKWLFAHTGRAKAREAGWNDITRVSVLYAAPNRWFIKDYQESLFSHPKITPRRYFSVFCSMMVRAEQLGGSIFVLESPDGRIVGAAPLIPVDSTSQSHVKVLDFLVYPTYVSQTSDLLEEIIKVVRQTGTEIVRTCFASCDREKKDLAINAGFRQEAVLVDHFKAGKERFDLEIYTLKV